MAFSIDRINPFILDRQPEILDLELEGTPLTGLPCYTVLSYLKNVQILEIILKGKTVSFENSLVKKKLNLRKNLDKSQKTKVLVVTHGIHRLKELHLKSQLLVALALKINDFLIDEQFLMITSEKPEFSLPENALSLLKQADKIREIELRRSSMTRENCLEIIKTLYLAGARELRYIGFTTCPNLLLDTGEKEFYESISSLYPHIVKNLNDNEEIALYKRYFQRVSVWFQKSLHYEKFKDLVEINSIASFPNVLIVNFGQQGMHYFKLDPDLIASVHTKILQRSESEFSKEEELLFKKIEIHMDKYDQLFHIFPKSKIVEIDPSLSKIKGQLTQKDVLKWEEEFFKEIKKTRQCEECFFAPDLGRADFILLVVNVLRTGSKSL